MLNCLTCYTENDYAYNLNNSQCECKAENYYENNNNDTNSPPICLICH